MMLSKFSRTFRPLNIISFSPYFELYTALDASLILQKTSVRYIIYHVVPFKNSNVHLIFPNSYRNFSSIYIVKCISI